MVIDARTERLAVYRVRKYDGVLQLLKRWPRELQVFDPFDQPKSTMTTFTPDSKGPGNVKPVKPVKEDKGSEEVEDPFSDMPPWRNSSGSGPRYITPSQGR